MLIAKNHVMRSKKTVERKKQEFWNEYYPSLKFDELGRCKIGEITGIPKESLLSDLVRCLSSDFRDSFNEYLEDRGYGLKDSSGRYFDNINFISWDIDTMMTGYFSFIKGGDKRVKVKMSKVLEGVQAFWLKKNPEYKDISDEMKEIRRNGGNFENSMELRVLSSRKSDMEWGNWYVAYQKLMNSNSKGRGIYISINPLDLLTSSGGYGENPTKLTSCWSTELTKIDEVVTKVRGVGGYASPEAILDMAEFNHRAICFVENGNTLPVYDGFEFIGYSERVHTWGDINGLWLERQYPSNTESASVKYKEALKEKGVNVIDRSEIDEFEEFTYQDSKRQRDFIRCSPNIFMDRVGFNYDDRLCKMKDDRGHYDYQDGYMLPDDEYGQTCEACGERHYEDNMYYVEYEGWFCESCYNDRYTSCDQCGDTTDRDYTYMAYDRNGYEVYVCEWCLDHNYAQCDECGDYHHRDNMHETTDGNYVCDDCVSNMSWCDGYEQPTEDSVYEVDDMDGLYSVTWLENNDYEICDECGKWSCEVEDGLCPNCTEELMDDESEVA